MLRLLGCLLEKPPWERPHGLSSLGVPACRKHCASPLHGYDSFITRGACLQASHVLPLSMGSFSIRERCNCKFILTPCTLKNIMPVGTGQPRLPTCGKILAEEISEKKSEPCFIGVPDRQASLVLPLYCETHSSPLVTSLEQLNWETRMTTKAKENSG